MKDILNRIVLSDKRLSSQNTNIKPYINQINNLTEFLNYSPIENFPEKIFCIINNITEKSKCKCGKYLKFNHINFKYKEFCSQKCKSVYSKNMDINILMEMIEYHFKNSKPFNFNTFAEHLPLLKGKTEWMDKKSTISNRCYCLYNNITEYPKCSCGNPITKFKNTSIEFQGHCSLQCSGKSSNRISKIIKTKTDNDYFTNVGKKIIQKRKKLIQSANVMSKEEVMIKGKELTDDPYFDISNVDNYLMKNDHNMLKSIDYYFKEHSKSEIFYMFKNSMSNPPKCFMCNNNSKFYTYNKGYGLFCDDNCYKIYYKRLNRYVILSNIIKTCNKDNLLINNYEEFIDGNDIEIVCKKGHVYSRTLSNFYKSTKCSACNGGKSHYETELYKFLFEHTTNIKLNDRNIISPLELDIYLPDHKLAIEFNGIYWHSEQQLGDKNYHLNKTELCEKEGIQLIHIFENEWIIKRNIIESVILSKLNLFKKRIYGRKCYIEEIDNNTKNKFLEQNHLQGKDNSSIKLGLFYKNKLHSVMTFGKRKITGGNTKFELIRYCSKLNNQIIGGASKLFKYFINNYKYDEITTYADRRFSNGNLYKLLGFNFSHFSTPNYWYHKDNDLELYHRIGFQKHKLDVKLDNYSSDLTEYNNMILNNYDRIWDCGNFVYIYKNIYFYK